MSFNRETGGRFFSPDNQAGSAPTTPSGDLLRKARMDIGFELSHVNTTRLEAARTIKASIGELLLHFSDHLPPVLYVTSYDNSIIRTHKGLMTEGNERENRTRDTLTVIELDTKSGELYQAGRDFVVIKMNFGDKWSPPIDKRVAQATITNSRYQLDTDGWLEFGERTRGVLEQIADAVKTGQPYENPHHKIYTHLPLVPDNPNPEPEIVLEPLDPE